MHTHQPLQIVVDFVGWEPPRNTPWNHNKGIKYLLKTCGDTIWQHCPMTVLDPIVVYRRKDHPQADDDRDCRGRIRVGLEASGTYWAQFAFQFAHEFCHLLAKQSNNPALLWSDREHCNFWLEESICEVASYFGLRALAVSWKSPAEWPFESECFGKYSSNRMTETARQLPQAKSFEQWFKEEEPFLQKHPVHGKREKNCIVASQLLPLFETNPCGWEALCFLNTGERILQKPLNIHLAEWQSNSPAHLRDFIKEVAAVFSISLGNKE